MNDLPREIALELERVELEAGRSTIECAPAEAVAALGLGWKPLSSGFAALAGKVDVLRFNCVSGLGVAAPAREADLDDGSIGAPGWRHYAAFDAGVPVGFGALFVNGGAGWLGVASTLASHRRQGVQSAVIAARLRDAARLGCRIVVVETADDTPEKPNPSTHNLVRAGFRVAYRRPNWVKVFAAPGA